MRLIKIIAGVLEVGAGILFVSNIQSDIQMGFGLVLLAIGINQILHAY